MGFEINPCDPCVTNKMVNGSQMMIRWHVDDLILSHLKQEKIMQVVQQIKDIYGKNLKENIGTVHDYLGMTFDYSFDKEVQINMWDYIKKEIREFPEEITGVCATPASDYLFKIREDGTKLNEKLQRHSITLCTSFYLLQAEQDVISKQQNHPHYASTRPRQR